MTTRGQQVITDLALAVEASTADREAVFALQSFAGVPSDGWYGPITAGVVAFVLDHAPPPTRTGKVTPYTPVPNSVLEIVLSGYVMPTCEVKVALAGAAGYAANSDETMVLLSRANLDEQSAALLHALADTWDNAYEIAEGNIGGVPHVQILPGLNGTSEVQAAGRAIVGWNDFFDLVSGIICPPIRQPTLADVESGETLPAGGAEHEQAAVVQNAPTTIPPATIVRVAVPATPPNVPPPIRVSNDIHLAQEALTFAAKDSFEAPVGTVQMAPASKRKPVWPWVAGGLVVAGGTLVLLNRRRHKR